MAVFKNIQECVSYVESHLEIRPATKNKAYYSGRTIKPNGSVNHSVGCAQPNPDVFFASMNNESAGWAVNAILGDFHKGDGRILLTMNWNSRPWGCGSGSKGSWNNTKVQWEVCEPAGHTYAGGTMVGYDVSRNQLYFDRMWRMLVAWNVYMAVKFGYSPASISDHAESYRAGMGSNHADMGQWLPKHGKSMDDLRNEVEEIMNAKVDSTNNEEEEEMTEEKIRAIVRSELAAIERERDASTVSLWASEYWNRMKESGLMDGNRPLAPLTRQEAATVLSRALDKIGK